jgi:hypothetical protein
MRSHSAHDPAVFSSVVEHKMDSGTIACLHVCVHIQVQVLQNSLDLAEMHARGKVAYTSLLRIHTS